jgi:hypothetical protein
MLERRMFANTGLGADRWPIACNLFIIGREAVSGLRDLQEHLVANSIFDDVVAMIASQSMRPAWPRGAGTANGFGFD